MPCHRERRVLPYSPTQMYDLVADVARYAEFLPWIAAVRIRSDSDTDMVADLLVGVRGLRERFSSHVAKSRPSAIHVDYLDGPLDHLRNDWTFAPDPAGCVVDFAVDFAFRNRVFEALAGQMFDLALRRMIGAFETRAAQLYGVVDLVGISRSSAHSAA